MSKLRCRGILPLIVLMLAADAGIAIAQQIGSVGAYSVTVRQGDTVMVTLISEQGIASTQFKIRSKDREMLRGAIVTIDGRVIGLNYRTGSYTMAPLDESIDHQAAERDLLLRGLNRPDLRMPAPKFAPPFASLYKGDQPYPRDPCTQLHLD